MTAAGQRRTPVILTCLLATAISVRGQEVKQMAITFDDLPFAYGPSLGAVKAPAR